MEDDTGASAATASLTVWARIKAHKVLEWTLAYAAAAYTLLHVVEMVGNAFDWPHVVARILTLLLALGVPIATTLAWYHGHRAQHRVTGPERALAAFRQVELREWSLSGQAMAEYSLGHADASQRLLDQLIAMGDDTSDLAVVYAWRGENDHAFEWLERSYERRDTNLPWIKIMPEFRGLRSDARYLALLRKMNLAE